MSAPNSHLIFVNQKPYRIWSGASLFRDEDFLRGFNATYHLQVARLLEAGLESENPEPAILGIRTMHGLASEAFFSLLFALLQAPEAPAAWMLLYRQEDIGELISKLESGEPFPCKFELGESKWAAVAHELMPIDLEDSPEARSALAMFSDFWAQLASDFRSDIATKEINALKHGFRARAASPIVTLGGRELPAAENGAWFPVLKRNQNEVLISIGCRSWSVTSLLAQLELISASLGNLLGILKVLHGVEEDLLLEMPPEETFKSARRPDTQVLANITLGTNWPRSMRPAPFNVVEALEFYRSQGVISFQRGKGVNAAESSCSTGRPTH